jgi:hypothetical protein
LPFSQLNEKPHRCGFVTGHGFSRADKADEINRASPLRDPHMPQANFIGGIAGF